MNVNLKVKRQFDFDLVGNNSVEHVLFSSYVSVSECLTGRVRSCLVQATELGASVTKNSLKVNLFF